MVIKLNRKHEQAIFVNSLPTRSLILYQPNIMDKVIEPDELIRDGNLVKIGNSRRDLSVLFEQERLNGFNPQFIIDYFNNNSSSDSLSELRAKCTDEQLIQLCKSRYIQRPQELQNYFEYLEYNYDSEVKRLISDSSTLNSDSDSSDNDSASD